MFIENEHNKIEKKIISVIVISVISFLVIIAAGCYNACLMVTQSPRLVERTANVVMALIVITDSV